MAVFLDGRLQDGLSSEMCCPYRCQNPTQSVQRRTPPGQNAAGGHLQSRTAAVAVQLSERSRICVRLPKAVKTSTFSAVRLVKLVRLTRLKPINRRVRMTRTWVPEATHMGQAGPLKIRRHSTDLEENELVR